MLVSHAWSRRILVKDDSHRLRAVLLAVVASVLCVSGAPRSPPAKGPSIRAGLSAFKLKAFLQRSPRGPRRPR